MFKLVLSERSKTPKSRALEILGSYNPHSKELQVEGERVKYWLGQGADMSKTVNNLLIDKEIIQGEKIKAIKMSKKRTEKIKQKQESEKEKQAAAAEEQGSSQETDQAPLQDAPVDEKEPAAEDENRSGDKPEEAESKDEVDEKNNE